MMESDTMQQAITRTQQTERRYGQLFAMFCRLAQDELDAGKADAAVPEPVRLALIFRAREAGWAAATARVYRSALVFGLGQRRDEAASQALDLLYHAEEDEQDRMVRQLEMQEQRRQRKMKQPAGSQQKATRFTRAQLTRLLEALNASRSQWAQPTADWFIAGLLTGLRPGEWCQAELVSSEGVSALQVRNAKATNDRSHGSSRTIVLAGLDDWQRALVVRHLARVKGYVAQDRYLPLYEGCRQLIRDAADRVFPKKSRHPTLYTARHLFAANAKTTFSQVEVAALMGHDSVDTAGMHYVERWSASGTARVRPSDADVDAVARRNPGLPQSEPERALADRSTP